MLGSESLHAQPCWPALAGSRPVPARGSQQAGDGAGDMGWVMRAGGRRGDERGQGERTEFLERGLARDVQMP